MSMTQTLAPHLPYLRRYARALTGSQRSGDAHVRAALQALLTGDHVLAEGVPPRVGLYRLFHAIWESGAEHYDDAATQAEPRTPENRLRALSASKRAALLLTAVEAFSPEEAAFIIDESPQEVEKAILDAQKTIDSQLASRVMIIEDEPIIAMDLENLVVELGHKVVAVASTKDEAVAKAHTERPGLVLADINLGEGGSGIDAVSEILAAFDIPVIFITAYPEKLLTGERPEPTYLIAKPFLPETVQATVGQALFFPSGGETGRVIAGVSLSVGDYHGRQEKIPSTVDNRLAALRRDFEALQADMKGLAGDVGAIATERGRVAMAGAEDVADRAMRLAEEAVREARQAAGEFREDAEEWAEENAENLRSQVREQPITSLLIAGGIGAFLGAIFLRR